MTRPYVFAALLLLPLGSGCRTTRTHDATARDGCRRFPPPATIAAVTGVVTRAQGGTYAFADLKGVSVTGSKLTRELSPGHTLHTAQPVKIHLSNPTGGEYDVAFGPHPDTPTRKVSAKVVNPLFIYGGYAFAWGRWPMARTQWIQAGAEGTTLVVEVLPGLQRVYFLRQTPNPNPEKITITCGTRAPVYLTAECTYVEFDKNCSNTDPAFIKDNADAKAFITAVKPIAEAAGWDEKGTVDCTQ